MDFFLTFRDGKCCGAKNGKVHVQWCKWPGFELLWYSSTFLDSTTVAAKPQRVTVGEFNEICFKNSSNFLLLLKQCM
jgi:hypothetical protein